MLDWHVTDLSYLESIGMGDDSLIIEMVELFLQNTPESLRLLQEHEREDNWMKLAAEAHKLKPNLSYVGLEKAKTILMDIEQSAKNGTGLKTIHSKIQQIAEICEQAYAELEQRLETLKN